MVSIQRKSNPRATTLLTLTADQRGQLTRRMAEEEDRGILKAAMEGVTLGAPIGLTVGAGRSFIWGAQGLRPAVESAPTSGATSAARAARKATAGMHPAVQIGTVAATFAAVGAIYNGTEVLLQNVRAKTDVWNKAIAGCAAGSVVGLRTANLPVSCGACASFATFTVLFSFVDGKAGPMVDTNALKRAKLYEPQK
jgi:hypothetical protein